MGTPLSRHWYQYHDILILMLATKFQVTLPIDFAKELKAAAARQGIPLAEWIRTAMQAELERVRRREPARTGHWLDNIVIDDEPDVSSRIDEILYGEASPHGSE
jgi:hypothetical protein